MGECGRNDEFPPVHQKSASTDARFHRGELHWIAYDTGQWITDLFRRCLRQVNPSQIQEMAFDRGGGSHHDFLAAGA